MLSGITEFEIQGSLFDRELGYERKVSNTSRGKKKKKKRG